MSMNSVSRKRMISNANWTNSPVLRDGERVAGRFCFAGTVLERGMMGCSEPVEVAVSPSPITETSASVPSSVNKNVTIVVI